MLLCSVTINSVCRNDNRRNDDGNDNRRNNKQPRCSPNNLGVQKPRCSTAMLAAPATLAYKSHAARQLCSPVLLQSLQSHAARQFCSEVLHDSSTLAGFCFCAHIASAIALTYTVTINQICLFDNCPMRQPTAFCLHDIPNNASNGRNKRLHATDSPFQKHPMVQRVVH
jgi:hypothetical protein